MNRADLLSLIDSIETQLATLRGMVANSTDVGTGMWIKNEDSPPPAITNPNPAAWWTGPAEYAKRTGVRLNNPLNVKRSTAKWHGQIGTDERGHVHFETPEYGIRAAMVNLWSYWIKHGLRTLEGIIGRWAPVTDTIGSRKGAPQNAPNEYAAWVAKKMGNIDPATPLNLFDRDGAVKDPAQLIDLITAMAEYEIGAGFTLNRETAAMATRLL